MRGGFLGGSRNYFGVLKGARAMWRGRTPDPGWVNRKSSIEPDPKKGRYVTDAIGDESVDFINKHAGCDEPFFLFTSFTSPHTPIQAKEQDLAQFPNLKGVRKKQAAMQLAEDRAVGRIISAIEAGGIEDETYVVFLNDNGGSNHSGINGHLRNFKGSVYEGGVRVPMVISGPGLAKGLKYNNIVTHMDFLPTFVKLAGGEIDREIDGVDILPFVQGKVDGVPHEHLCFRHTGAGVAVRSGNWKLINPNNPGEHGKRKAGQWELYNLGTDPSEKNNLAAKLPEKVTELKQKIADWEVTLPKNRWGQFGKQDRNYFDSFTFNPSKNGSWSVKDRWSNDKSEVTMHCQDLYPNAELVFPSSNSNQYSAVNDLYSASGLNAMLNRLAFTATNEKVTLSGNPLRLVPSLGGDQPKIMLSDKVNVEFKLPLVAKGSLQVDGKGSIAITGGLKAENIIATCNSFGIRGKNQLKNLKLSCSLLSMNQQISIGNELAIGENCTLAVLEQVPEDSVLIRARKIVGNFSNKTVKLNGVSYELIQDESTISLKKIGQVK